MKLLDKQVSGKITIMDSFALAILKNVEERVMTRFVGNGTLFSGGVKLAAGLFANSMGSGKNVFTKGLNLLGTATIIDGAEDIVTYVLPKANIQSLRSSSGTKPERRVL